MAATNQHRTKLLVTRIFPAVRERIFQAWTNPRDLNHWWYTGKKHVPDEIEESVTTGGELRLGMISGSTGQELAVGEFCEIDPTDHFSMTWRCSVHAARHSMPVDVVLFDHGRETELLLSHEGFASTDECEVYSRCWNAILDDLAKFLSETESAPIELSAVIPVPKWTVFEALIRPKHLAKWFATRIENDPVTGGEYVFAWEFPHEPAMNYSRQGRYTEVVSAKSVTFTWDVEPHRRLDLTAGNTDAVIPTVVEFRLTTDSDGGTRVLLVHAGWSKGPDWDIPKDTEFHRWTRVMKALKSYLEAGADGYVKPESSEKNGTAQFSKP